MAPLVSVIVPVYNAGIHLEDCLASLTRQTLPADAYEIIVVDDKSSDGSLEIARAFERQHDNLRVIALPERTPGGPGLPSNIGIKTATGKYVAFLDHDDAAYPEMLAKLSETAEAENADVTFCSFTMLKEGVSYTGEPYDLEYWNDLFSPHFEALPLIEQKKCYLKVAPAPWRKLHKREYLHKNNILFPVFDAAFEDTAFHWRVVIPAQKLARLDEKLILYKTGRPEQTTSMDIQKAVPHLVHQLKDIQNFLNKNALFSTYQETLKHLAATFLDTIPQSSPVYLNFLNEIIRVCENE